MQAPDCFRDQLLATLPRLRRYARSLVPDTGSADDLLQTTLERTLSHWHQFDPRRDLLVWLLSITHNAFMDQRRRDGRLSIIGPALVEAQPDALQSDPALIWVCASTCWPRGAACRWTSVCHSCWSVSNN